MSPSQKFSIANRVLSWCGRIYETYLSKSSTRTFLIFYGVLLVGILHTYFPPHAIAVTSNDQIDSFLAYFGIVPEVWETIFHVRYELSDNMSGVTLNSIGFSEFNIGRIIASVFPDYWEFSIFFLIYLSALFVSSYLLYRQMLLMYFGEEALSVEIYAFIGFAAIIVTTLPHISVVLGVLIGLNFFALGALSVLNNAPVRRVVIYFVVAGLFGNFALGGYFYMPASLVLAAWFSRRRPDKMRVLKWLAVGILISVLCEYRLYIYIFFPAEVSHRANWFEGLHYSWASLVSFEKWSAAFQLGLDVIAEKTPHYHYQWNTGNLVIRLTQLIVGAYFLIKLGELVSDKFKHLRWADFEARALALFFWTTFAIIIVLLGYGVFKAGVFNLSLILNMPFQFERVVVALPMLSGLLIVSSLFLLSTKVKVSAQKAGFVIMGVSGALVLGQMVHEPLVRKNANLTHFAIAGRDNPFIPSYTLGSKYNRGGYEAIKTYLGDAWREERVASIGFDPMATAYNGFATVDGYFPNYPERYQQDFLEIIEPSLSDISPSQAARYTGWGNRLNIPIVSTTDDKKIVLNIDACAFRDTGGTLLIAVKEVANAEVSQIELEAVVNGANRGLKSTFWLYRPRTDQCVASGNRS